VKNKPTISTFECLFKRAGLFAFILLLTACAASDRKSSETSDNLEVELAINTFSAGFRHIAERYIEPIPASKLALEGLRGLDTIDPSFQVEIEQEIISIQSNTIPRLRYTTLAKNDFRGWADLVVQILRDVQNEDPQFKNTKMANLYEAVFDGSLSLLDAFSRYASVDKAQRNREKRSGFGGVGIRFKQVDKGITVTQVFAETPAFRAGLKLNDIVTHADGKPLAGLKRRAAGRFLRGEIGSIVDITVRRPIHTQSKPTLFTALNFSIKRDRIVAPTASHSVRNGIVYLRLSGFNNRTTRQVARNLVQGLREAQEQSGQKAKGVILDLRGNPGGLLKQAVNVSDLFLVDGRIISTRGRHPASEHDYDARGTDLTDGLPLVVLINGRSASASEIVAAALQDHERAIVIGSTSYGKGTVQTVIRLPNDGEITLTWSRFQAPSGYFLHELGVPPSICASKEKKTTASEYIEAALGQASQLSATLKAWHTVTTKQKSERDRLKSICPTTNKRDPLDIKIAEILLLDAALFQRVKALSPSLASAGK
jgi:carboxyl-terminal processing protease